MLAFGSLFSGIGGIDLGLERAGWTCRWQVEIDPFNRTILRKHWPGVTQHGDITKITGDELEPVDLLAGGFPCQDLSYAGKQAGIEASRSGLWFEFARLIGELRPRYVLIENVPGLLVHPECDEWSENWPDAGMWGYGEVSGLVSLAPLISESGCSSLPCWPTPTEDNANNAGGPSRTQGALNGGYQDLTVAANMWTTPQAHDAVGGKTPEQSARHKAKTGSGARNLNEDIYTIWVAEASLFSPPDPVTQDGPPSSEPDRTSRRLWSTPKDDHSYRQGTVAPSEGNGHGRTLGGDVVAFQGVEKSRKRLNPRFVAWLMGFPPNWTEL